MKKIMWVALIALLATACKKEEDVNCENAVLYMCNYTANQIVPYSWGSNQVEDTLFPGECHPKYYGKTVVTYDMWGDEDLAQTQVALFYTLSGSMYIEMKVCESYMEAPFGYQDISFCYNGTFDPDQGEYGTDCGGKCLPCDNLEAPCSAKLEDDVLDWKNQNKLSFPSSFDYEVDNKMRVQFTFGNGEELTMKLPIREYGKANRQFITGKEFREAEITYYNRIRFRRPVDGQLIYLITDSLDNKKIEFCDLEFTDGFNRSYASGSLEID